MDDHPKDSSGDSLTLYESFGISHLYLGILSDFRILKSQAKNSLKSGCLPIYFVAIVWANLREKRVSKAVDCILPADFIACSFLESQLHSFDDEQVFAAVPFLVS